MPLAAHRAEQQVALIQNHLADIAVDGNNGAAQRLTVGGQRRDGKALRLLSRDKTSGTTVATLSLLLIHW